MIGTKSAVPIREVVSKAVDDTPERAHGDAVIRGEGDEKEVGLFWVLSDEGAVEERRDKEGLGWSGEN